MKVIFDQEILGIMNLIGRLSQARLKDCFKDDDTYYCTVERGDIGKAIGKGGITINRIKQSVNKKVKMIEFGSDAADYVRNFIYPIKVEEIKEENGVVSVFGGDKKTKSILIGRDGRNLKLLNKAVKRFYDVEVKVV
ncbi:MAG: NusA-like transcription termination signal-binding factor [Candidatus Woesearchaeota archaeon]